MRLRRRAPVAPGLVSTYRRRWRLPARAHGPALVVTFLLFAAAGYALFSSAEDGLPAASTLPDSVGVRTSAEPTGPPNPFFASYRSLQLRLPVRPDEVTALAFHQAAGDTALHLDSLIPDAHMDDVAAAVADGQPFASNLATASPGPEDDPAPAPSPVVWRGSALRLWRSNRAGPPDTAVDVGAAPGTRVRSPVSGEVVEVRAYQLYEEWDDFEIHIQPDGWPEVDLVLIHVADVAVAKGDRVVGGLTRVASVRRLSDRVDLQLGTYAAGGGDHVHLQLNEVAVPGVLDLVGES